MLKPLCHLRCASVFACVSTVCISVCVLVSVTQQSVFLLSVLNMCACVCVKESAGTMSMSVIPYLSSASLGMCQAAHVNI